ncbi:MAG: hypothetical protein V1735_00725 [Nanoarchaeota archaeon]
MHKSRGPNMNILVGGVCASITYLTQGQFLGEEFPILARVIRENEGRIPEAQRVRVLQVIDAAALHDEHLRQTREPDADWYERIGMFRSFIRDYRFP